MREVRQYPHLPETIISPGPQRYLPELLAGVAFINYHGRGGREAEKDE